MTTDWQALGAGRELDALVAERGMGLSVPFDENTPCPECGATMYKTRDRARCGQCNEWRYGPYREYSSEDAPALDILTHLAAQGWLWRLDNAGEDAKPGRIRCIVWASGIAKGRIKNMTPPDAPVTIPYTGEADTIALAICRAALAAVASTAPRAVVGEVA